MIRTNDIYWLLMVVFLGSCQKTKKIEPVVPSGDRIILLEEFTGKACTNCPKGNREIDNLLSIYGENLVVVSIHAGFFANPDFFSLGSYDLRAPESNDLFSLMAPNIGYPAGVVNRVPFDGLYQHGANEWAAFITSELEREPAIELSIDVVYDSLSRTAQVSLAGLAKEDITGELRVSVMFVENGIIDAQDDFEAGGIVEDYEHNHVLRGMPTDFRGEVVGNGLLLGERMQFETSFALDTLWSADHMEVVAFISRVGSSSDFSVLQAVMKTLIE